MRILNILNDRNYPPEVIIAMQRDFYDGQEEGVFASPSSLDEPPKLFWTKKHVVAKGLPIPASSLFAILEGNMHHHYFESVMQDNPDYIVERRLYGNLEIDGRTFKLSGKFDLTRISTANVRDWKTMSIKKYKMADFDHYFFQQNVYKWLWEKNHRPIKTLTLLIRLRDWTKYSHIKDRSIPNAEIFEMPVPVWPNGRIEAEIKIRIMRLLKYENIPASSIEPCSKEERWQYDEVWPVFKKTKAGGIRVDEKALPKTAKFSKEQANFFISSRKDAAELYTKCRKSIPIRCLDWCSVAKTGICQFYNEWAYKHREDLEGDELDDSE